MMSTAKEKNSFEWALNDVFGGEAVLFLGAGASKLAYSNSGTPLPTGQELANVLAQECGAHAGYPLSDITTHFIRERSEGALIRTLNKYLKVADVDKNLQVILNNPWLRIWTTNYDDACKIAHDKLSLNTLSLTTADDIANSRVRRRMIFHINGLLSRLSHTLTPDFILTSRDYATQCFVDSDWSTVFKDDLRRAKAIIFLGYSLADVDIARLIMAPHISKSKIHFIECERADPILISKLEDFGCVHTVGVKGFSNAIEKSKPDWQKPALIESYESFHKVQSVPSSGLASDDQFFDLIIFGDLNDGLLTHQIENPSNSQYVLIRAFEDECASVLSTANSIALLAGSFGSGKSVAARSIALRVAETGRDVFVLSRKNDRTEDEIVTLCRRETPFTLVLDSLSKNQRLVESYLRNATEKCSLLITERTELYDFSIKELEKRSMNREVHFYDLDRLTNDEIEKVIDLITLRGVWGERAGSSRQQQQRHVISACDRQMHSVLLDIVKAPIVLEKLSTIVDGISENSGAHSVLMTICLLQCIGEEPYLDLLEDLLGLDFDDFRRITSNDYARQIMTASTNRVNFRSPIIGAAILTTRDDAKVVTNVLTECIINAKKLSGANRQLGYIAGSMIRYGNLERFLPSHGRRIALQNLYEGVKMYFRDGQDPVFWLQYGIARISLGDLTKARRWFDNAYEYGKKNPNFPTSTTKVHIDNHYARLLFREALDHSDPNEAFDLVRDALELIKTQVLRRNRHYPYRVAGGLEEPARRHLDSWSESQTGYILQSIENILEAANSLDSKLARHRHVIEGRRRLEIVRDLIEENERQSQNM